MIISLTDINRNFGSPDSKVFFASPTNVAVSTVEGMIADPRNYQEH